MCSGNFKSKCLRQLLNATDEKNEEKFIVKLRNMKIKKNLRSTEDNTKDGLVPEEKFVRVEQNLLSKIQLRILHEKISNLMSWGYKSEELTELMNATNEKTRNQYIFKVKGKKVKKTILLPPEPKSFLAKRKFRVMEKPLLRKLQLCIMRKKINRKIIERDWKKLLEDLEIEDDSDQ